MIYTSGTTGRPKGVRRQPMTAEQEARMADYRERVYGLKPGVRTMIPGPLYHSAPNAFALRAARVASLIALMPRFDPEAFLALVEQHRIEAMFMVPTMFVRLLKLPERGAQPLRPLLAQVRHARRRALPARGQARR